MSVAIGGAGNPDRIASNIVTGIGFLGAGVIFHGKNHISGITTAATIWTVAAVGMGIGAGYYFASACASLSILFILAVLPSLQKQIDRLNQSRSFYIRSHRESNAVMLCEGEMKRLKIKYKLIRQVRDGEKIYLTWTLHGRSENMSSFFESMFKAEYIDFMES